VEPREKAKRESSLVSPDNKCNKSSEVLISNDGNDLMLEGGSCAENYSDDMMPTPRKGTRVMHSPNEERDQGGEEYYRNEINEGFEIINEVINENDFLS